MTAIPHSVTVDQSLADALHRMRTLGVRHLPVTDEGHVVGILREGEIAALCEHGRADSHALAVGEVVDPYSCLLADPDMPLTAAVQAMAIGKLDCCAVIERDRLTGILTTQDLVEHLSELLLHSEDRRSLSPSPSEVRLRVLGEHSVLRQLYSEVDVLARAVLQGEGDQASQLHARCRELYQTLIQHMDMENALLAPVLRESDSFGPLRASQLIDEHARQRRTLFAVLAASEERASGELAGAVLQLIGELRTDMAYEEQSLLDPDLLRDDPIAIDASSG